VFKAVTLFCSQMPLGRSIKFTFFFPVHMLPTSINNHTVLTALYAHIGFCIDGGYFYIRIKPLYRFRDSLTCLSAGIQLKSVSDAVFYLYLHYKFQWHDSLSIKIQNNLSLRSLTRVKTIEASRKNYALHSFVLHTCNVYPCITWHKVKRISYRY
jgi:hypothetical protein